MIHPNQFVLALISAFLVPTASAATLVYVAFNEPLPHTITYADQIVDEVDCGVSASVASGVDAPSQQAILAKLAQHYLDAGVDDMVFTSQRPARPDVTVLVDTRAVTGPDGFLLDECTGLSLDRFNRRSGEEVVVNLSVLAGGQTDVDLAAQVIAHEVGHAFGLRHAFSAADNGTNPKGIMRPGGFEGGLGTCQQNCEFLNTISPVSEKPGLFAALAGFVVDPIESLTTTNAVYHLRRYVTPLSKFEVEGTGVCPGSWDTSLLEDVRRVFSFLPQTQAASMKEGGFSKQQALPAGTVYDVQILEWYGNDIPRRLDRLPQATLTELFGQQWALPGSSQFEIIAASSPGGARDIALAKVDAGGGLAFAAFTPTDGETFSLIRLTGPGTYEVLADLQANVKTVRAFSDGFELSDQVAQAASASSVEASATASSAPECISGIYTASALFKGVQIARRSDGAECGWQSEYQLTLTLDLTSEFPRFDIEGPGGGVLDPSLDSDPDDGFNCASQFTSELRSGQFLELGATSFREDPAFYPNTTNFVRGRVLNDYSLVVTYTSEGENSNGSGRFSLTTGEVSLQKQLLPVP